MALELLTPQINKQREQIDEYEQKLKKVKAEYDSVSADYNFKERELRYIQDEIIQQQKSYLLLDEKIAKEHEKKISDIVSREKQATQACEEYEKLIADAKSRLEDISKKEFALSEKERYLESENKRWEKHARDTESETNLVKRDVERREKILFDERNKFEEEKKSLKPQMNKISELKNQNAELLRKIEEAQQDVEKQRNRMSYEHDRNKIEITQMKEAQRANEDRIIEKEKALLKREQDLSDYELELKAKEVEADKIIRRANLNKKIDEGSNKEN